MPKTKRISSRKKTSRKSKNAAPALKVSWKERIQILARDRKFLKFVITLSLAVALIVGMSGKNIEIDFLKGLFKITIEQQDAKINYIKEEHALQIENPNSKDMNLKELAITISGKQFQLPNDIIEAGKTVKIPLETIIPKEEIIKFTQKVEEEIEGIEEKFKNIITTTKKEQNTSLFSSQNSVSATDTNFSENTFIDRSTDVESPVIPSKENVEKITHNEEQPKNIEVESVLKSMVVTTMNKENTITQIPVITYTEIPSLPVAGEEIKEIDLLKETIKNSLYDFDNIEEIERNLEFINNIEDIQKDKY